MVANRQLVIRWAVFASCVVVLLVLGGVWYARSIRPPRIPEYAAWLSGTTFSARRDAQQVPFVQVKRSVLAEACALLEHAEFVLLTAEEADRLGEQLPDLELGQMAFLVRCIQDPSPTVTVPYLEVLFWQGQLSIMHVAESSKARGRAVRMPIIVFLEE